jgi:hypothetical protein
MFYCDCWGPVDRSDYNGYFEWGSGFVKPDIKNGFSAGVVKLQFTNDLCQLADRWQRSFWRFLRFDFAPTIDFRGNGCRKDYKPILGIILRVE